MFWSQASWNRPLLLILSIVLTSPATIKKSSRPYLAATFQRAQNLKMTKMVASTRKTVVVLACVGPLFSDVDVAIAVSETEPSYPRLKPGVRESSRERKRALGV